MKKSISCRESNIKNLTWWSWVEICDSCGEVIHGKELETTMKPDETEADYCVKCLREKLKLRGNK